MGVARRTVLVLATGVPQKQVPGMDGDRHRFVFCGIRLCMEWDKPPIFPQLKGALHARDNIGGPLPCPAKEVVHCSLILAASLKSDRRHAGDGTGTSSRRGQHITHSWGLAGRNDNYPALTICRQLCDAPERLAVTSSGEGDIPIGYICRTGNSQYRTKGGDSLPA